jgi:hypothetical protein
METNEAKIFVVRFAGSFFYTRRGHKGEPLGSLYPSQAQAMTYATAFQLAQILRAVGFIDAIVCGPTGMPSSVKDIYTAKDARESEEFQRVWAEPATAEPAQKQ